MTTATEKSFAELAQDPVGTIYVDAHEEGARYLVMRGPVSLTAYLGIPLSHPLAGHDGEKVPLDVHYGLTFAGAGDDKWRPSGWYWYGWDYAHSGDMDFSIFKYPRGDGLDEKPWTVSAVLKETKDALYDFLKLMRLAEEIFARAKGWRGV